MTCRGVLILVVLAVGTPLSGPLLAQNPTGSLIGRVTSNDGGAIPGVTVTARSDALQGERRTGTGLNGDYKLAFLPAGDYVIVYELDGFKSARRNVRLSAAQTAVSNVTMEIGDVTEEIVVTSQNAEISETLTGASTVTHDVLDALPVARTLDQGMNLVPGVANTGFRSLAPSISGAPTFENLILVNGVAIQDNIRNTFLNLYIEDAVQETTTAVSGISAEYGRFTGGVVNALTKSGGNRFSGSLRLSLSNESWEAETPLTTVQADDVNQIWEGTLGGYFVKDHLWFFFAGRDRGLEEAAQTDFTNTPYARTDDETRLELKLTVSPNASHTIIGSYLELERDIAGWDFGTILDLRSVNANVADPQDLTSINYNGVLSQKFFLEAQYSERNYIIGQGSGGPQDLIEGTLIRTRNESFRYWAPTFCGTCEDEQRDNTNFLAKGTYFATSGRGTHDIIFGFDTYDDIRFVINHQTGSDFTVYGSDVVRDANGDPLIDPRTDSAIPVFDPTASSQPWVRWFAVFNEDLAQPTSFVTNSYYVNDRWQLNDKWSFNVGLRYDVNDGVDSSGAKVADDSKLSPRLGATWDLKGDGDIQLRAAYGSYTSALANGVADDASGGGAIGSLRYTYVGPPINVGCTGASDCKDARQVLEEVFEWYTSLGGVFDLGQLDPNAPIAAFQNQNNVPGATEQIIGGIASPGADEYVLGVSKRLGSRGLLRADLVFRKWNDFYGDLTSTSTPKVETSTGPADVTLIGNFNDGISREYRALQTYFNYRINQRLNLAGVYTLSKTDGNFLGETTNSGPVRSSPMSYPEYREQRWNYPDGDLRVDQRHKLRFWGIYDILNGRRQRLNTSLLFNYFSGSPYGANAGIDPRPYVDNPGYEDPPSSVTYWFTETDAFLSDNITRWDLAFTYSFAFGKNSGYEVFIQPQVINLFNEQGVIDPLGLDRNDSGIRLLDRFNPFTETPVEGVNWEKRSTFGEPLNQADYQTPRTFRFSVGFRF